MLLRIFLFVLLLCLVYRVFRDVFRSALRRVVNAKDQARTDGKKPSWRDGKNRIRDAEFRDLDS